jgi:protein SCO1/2
MTYLLPIRTAARWLKVLGFAWLLALTSGASAQLYQEPKGLGAANVKPSILDKVGIDQRLNEQLPLQTTFHDESGRTVQLGEYFKDRPVVLALVYYTCPMLCSEVLNGLTSSLKMVQFTAGKEFDVVAISINPREGPADALKKRAGYIQRYHRPGSEVGWHFLTGDEPSIQAVAKAAGFRYTWDPSIQQYAHASGIMVLTPQGKLAQYYYGIEYSPRDLRLGLINASENKIGSLVDQLLLYCYHYDPATGKYSLAILRLVRVAGAATALGIGVLVIVLFRRERPRPLVKLRREDYKGIRT